MIPALQYINPDQSILRLSPEEIQEPFSILENLCSDFSLGQLRNSLSETLEPVLWKTIFSAMRINGRR